MCGLPLGSPEEGGDWRRVEARGREEGPRKGLMTGAKANYGRQLGQAPCKSPPGGFCFLSEGGRRALLLEKVLRFEEIEGEVAVRPG